MRLLAFVDEDRHFDGHCVRFQGKDGAASICCAITAAALKEQDRHLPRHGLVPAEMFLDAFDRHQIAIHDAARRKYHAGHVEPAGEIRILIHRQDL